MSRKDVIWSTAAVVFVAAIAAQVPIPVESASDYWDRGQAEVARYDLVQSRYGQPREGHAVLVFVTEPFRTDTQVKDERGADPAASERVLKLNRIQRFTTGVYDYSMMQSVFTPFEGGRTFKTTTSIQDWCGHVWSQLNLDGDAYRVTGHSYFESEGEESSEIQAAWLEDELLNVVRLNPDLLPTGSIDVIPGAFDARLRHVPQVPQSAIANLADGADGIRRYSLQYTNGRRFEIDFEPAAPFGILAYREILGRQKTEARRTHVEMMAYWGRSGRGDDGLRESLGLESGDIGRASKR